MKEGAGYNVAAVSVYDEAGVRWKICLDKNIVAVGNILTSAIQNAGNVILREAS